MCGISGFAGDFQSGLVSKMNSAQAHRGPDGQGVFEDPYAGVALGHVRLSILDLSTAAAQPMYAPDGCGVLVFNGEIYNFQELRQDLVARGHTFHSTGDSEVLLHGLLEYGAEFITRLNGIFAFAWWDARTRELLLARDPLGVKPLYYAAPALGQLLFASEIKALLQHPQLSREPDFIALQQHLAYSHSVGERTALKSVRRLPPGCWLRWRTGQPFAIHRYWQAPFNQELLNDRQTALADLRLHMQSAIQRQMVADVPVGMLLSGGLDSSLIATLASRHASAGFDCFTIAYSHEENTSAFLLEDNVPVEVKMDRVNEVMQLQSGIAAKWNAAQIGKRLKVLVDRKESSVLIGRTEFDSPEVDNEVILEPFDDVKPGDFVEVEIIDAEAYDLVGKIQKKLK